MLIYASIYELCHSIIIINVVVEFHFFLYFLTYCEKHTFFFFFFIYFFVPEKLLWIFQSFEVIWTGSFSVQDVRRQNFTPYGSLKKNPLKSFFFFKLNTYLKISIKIQLQKFSKKTLSSIRHCQFARCGRIAPL